MILFISYGDQRLAITVQPSRQKASQPSAQLLGQSLLKALSQSLEQTSGGRA